MFKHVLLGVDGSEISRNAGMFAFWLSKLWNSHLETLHVVDTTHLKAEYMADISGSLGFEPFGNFVAQEEHILSELANLIIQNFQNLCDQNSADCEITKSYGPVGTTILDALKRADIIVVGARGVNAAFHKDRMGSTTEYLLRRTSRPMIIVPAGASPPKELVVAYDDSGPSYKALSHAADFAQKMSAPLHVIHACEVEERADTILANAKKYLEPYDIPTQIHRLGNHVEDEILDYLGSHPNTMLYIGLHGHGMLKELLLGSTAEYIVNRTSSPIYCVP